MKKTIYTIGALMFITVMLKPMLVFGQGEQFSGKEEDVPFSASRIFSKIVSATGLNPSANWAESFGTDKEEDVGQDLYLTIYKKALQNPEEQAYKNVAGRYGLTEADMVRISQGDISALLGHTESTAQGNQVSSGGGGNFSISAKRGTTLTIDQAQQKVAEMQEQLKQESEIQSLEADVKATTEPSEIFANGDVSDSGFDLINDLNIIEKLLFLHSSPIDVGGNWNPFGGNGSGNNGGSAASGGPAAGSGNNPNPGSAGGNGSATQNQNGGGGSGSGSNSQTGDTTAGQAGPYGLDPAGCFGASGYQKAFDAFDQKPAGGNGSAGSGNNGGNSGNGGNGNSGAGNSNNAVTGINPSGFLPAQDDTAATPVQAPPADEWKKPLPCSDVFCIKIEEIKKQAKSKFGDTDNCIACHVEKMNDVLKDIVGHTLIPGKVPGNLGEMATCKKGLVDAFGAVSMGVYAISQPIKTPVNDDLVYGTNIEDDWKNFCEATSFFGACDKPSAQIKDLSVIQTPDDLRDQITKKILNNAPNNTTIDTVVNKIDSAVANQIDGQQQATDDLATSNIVKLKSGLYTGINLEMDMMNRFFANYSLILQSLTSTVDGFGGEPTCEKLRNKKECE